MMWSASGETLGGQLEANLKWRLENPSGRTLDVWPHRPA